MYVCISAYEYSSTVCGYGDFSKHNRVNLLKTKTNVTHYDYFEYPIISNKKRFFFLALDKVIEVNTGTPHLPCEHVFLQVSIHLFFSK